MNPYLPNDRQEVGNEPLDDNEELGQWADETTGSPVHEYPSDEEQGIEREDND